MKGRVYRRGKSWYYRFDIEPDPLTGKRRQVNGSGYRTEREAWKECRAGGRSHLTRAQTAPGSPLSHRVRVRLTPSWSQSRSRVQGHCPAKCAVNPADTGGAEPPRRDRPGSGRTKYRRSGRLGD
jgi:hypothetical protein